MKPFLQGILLWLFRHIRDAGGWETRLGDALYGFAYKIYKNLEAGDIRVLRTLIRPGSTVVDVGAYIGFFSLMFGRWVKGGGKVICLEPEETNFKRLEQAISKTRFRESIEALPIAAAEKTETVELVINPDNPVDHYLGDGGITVPATTIDDLLRDRGDPDVSLIKIDVQGGEERVIEGAAETLKRTCPALFVEVDGPSLSRSGGSVEILLDRLSGHGYAPYLLRDGNIQEACTADSLKRHIGIQGYSDVLFLPRGWSPPEGSRQSQPRATPVLLFAAFSAVIIAAWYWLNVAQGIGFWWVSSDYPYLSLSHALSIENWFMGSGERVVTPEKKMHPGIPFQFVSWLALRMSALMGPPTSLDGLLIATLQNPETYWRSALLFVLAMTLGGFFLIWRISRPYGWPVTLAACLSCLTLYGFWQYGIMELGNESFALLGAGLFFLTARAAFESKTGSAANWIIFGCVGAAAYLVKLHYIA